MTPKTAFFLHRSLSRELQSSYLMMSDLQRVPDERSAFKLYIHPSMMCYKVRYGLSLSDFDDFIIEAITSSPLSAPPEGNAESRAARK